MMSKIGLWLVLLVSLSACSLAPQRPVDGYRLATMQHLQKLEKWRFDGRLAMADERDSISASISWRHQSGRDEIELAGPLAQGRVVISVTADKVVIDDGEHRQEYSGPVNVVVAEQLGVDMPVDALKYWVLGVNDPKQSFIDQENGFVQSGWLVRFAEMQQVNLEVLPKKMTAQKDKTRIKLIVDQWDFS